MLGATNEYGDFDQRALAMYDLDMVVEPYRETTLSVVHSATPTSTFHPSTRFRWFLVPADESGAPLQGEKALVDAKGGVAATVTLTEPGKNYALLVEQLHQDGAVVAFGKVTVACKYVRRELRDLTDRDRNDFFAAMQEFYTVSGEEGHEKYGSEFFNSAKVTAYHNSKVGKVDEFWNFVVRASCSDSEVSSLSATHAQWLARGALPSLASYA